MFTVEHHQRSTELLERGVHPVHVLGCAAKEEVAVGGRPHVSVRAHGITADEQLLHAIVVQCAYDFRDIHPKLRGSGLVSAPLTRWRQGRGERAARGRPAASAEALATAPSLADADDGAEGSTCDCSVVREPVHWLRRRAARATRA